jgi:hypothetical protein
VIALDREALALVEGDRRGGGHAYRRGTAPMRAGRTKRTALSVDAATIKGLKALAARRHKGNVSALLAEIAARKAKFAAAEAYFDQYGVPPLSEKALAQIEAEWRGERSPRKTHRPAASRQQ